MANTHTIRFSGGLTVFLMSLALAVIAAPAQAGVSQGRLLISATVIEACSLNLAPTFQGQQANRFKEIARVSSCEGQRPATVPASQKPTPTTAEPIQRGLYNLTIDEAAGQVTLFF
jgi:hypothetical protein